MKKKYFNLLSQKLTPFKITPKPAKKKKKRQEMAARRQRGGSSAKRKKAGRWRRGGDDAVGSNVSEKRAVKHFDA